MANKRKRNWIVISFSAIGIVTFFLLMLGPGLVQDPKFRLLSQLANEGDDPGYQRLLAEYYYDRGDFRASLEWEQKAANNGDTLAQNFMGYYYKYGINKQFRPEALDYARALEWFKKAAATDFQPSEAELCEMYNSGLGTAANQEEAYFWCSLAESTERIMPIRKASKEALDEGLRLQVESRVASWLAAHRTNR